MTVDLFKYYKMLNQRAGRPPADPLKDEMAGIARYIVKEQPPRRSMLKAARILMRLEKQLATRCYFQTWYGNLTFAAIESGDFEINVPPYLHAWHRDDASGHLYIATAARKPDQVKLGVTDLPIKTRFRLYHQRYAYPLTLVYSRYVEHAFVVEDKLKKLLSDRRVAHTTRGDSNEWFRMTASELEQVVESAMSAASAVSS